MLYHKTFKILEKILPVAPLAWPGPDNTVLLTGGAELALDLLPPDFTCKKKIYLKHIKTSFNSAGKKRIKNKQGVCSKVGALEGKSPQGFSSA